MNPPLTSTPAWIKGKLPKMSFSISVELIVPFADSVLENLEVVGKALQRRDRVCRRRDDRIRHRGFGKVPIHGDVALVVPRT